MVDTECIFIYSVERILLISWILFITTFHFKIKLFAFFLSAFEVLKNICIYMYTFNCIWVMDINPYLIASQI